MHDVPSQKVAASCVWLASKLEESPRKARQVLVVFHRMECRRENLPIEHLDIGSKVKKLFSVNTVMELICTCLSKVLYVLFGPC